ncbi:hypothetical protein FHR99_003251 [Litorivivens lipolytica]|uniref:SPW repeat-containing protein n=1 Tax=Litorivivens lipolytica TaxID=1524264 RepID=A0A7W4Z775_9GAMM|nr:DUF6804 family protein [Litorivivens lipolytica]MBB3048977.1 hypothetical protein [Litorivivens lipolytica]
MPLPVIFIAAGLLLLGFMPLPYGYYTFLRIVATIVFVWGAFVLHEQKEPVLPWVFGLVAILFNPFIPVHLPKDIWAGIDLVAGCLLIATHTKLAKKEVKE